MLTGRAADLLGSLRRTLPSWSCALDGDRVIFSRTGGTPYVPPRRRRTWRELLARMETACAEGGIPRASPLPLQGLGDAALTFSAVQALDPYLKRRQPYVYGAGFLPQAVVRLNGDRDHLGRLQPGFLTSFVNVSIVQPISDVGDHAALIDIWLTVLSRLSLHTRHVTIEGRLVTWQRPPVSGITLRFRHDGLALGDAVLLWSADDEGFLATDIGSGLERLQWALTRQSWPQVVFGPMGDEIDTRFLDALRTSTLLVGSGIRPAARGPGSSVRRLLRTGDDRLGVLGLSRTIRWAYDFWSIVQPLPLPWPEVCRALDDEVLGNR